MASIENQRLPLQSSVPDAARLPAARAACGEGAVAGGSFHVGLNFAALWKAPVVFVVATTDELGRQTASRNVAIKGRAYGIPGVEVDGGDAFAVESAVRAAL